MRNARLREDPPGFLSQLADISRLQIWKIPQSLTFPFLEIRLRILSKLLSLQVYRVWGLLLAPLVLMSLCKFVDGSPVVVHSFSCVRLFVTRWTASHQALLSSAISQNLFRFMFIESVMPSNHPIFCGTLLLLPSIFPSIRVFSKESVLHIRCPEYWSFSFSIRPSNEHSGLISFRIDWLYLLAVQRTLKSLLQLHNSKASVPLHSVFFMVQLSHPYMTTGKTIALTIWAFVSKAMSLFFNTLFRFIIAFLPRSKCLLISWLQ